MTENTIITASGRTREEITASVRIHMRSMVNNALEIGMDLVEMKEACQHGEWLPWLKEIGLSASTAANYMRIAREVNGDSKMAQLPYTKILALLSAPAEEREELAAAAEDMSAAEIRRLTEERNRAAEAANTETMRADQAEADAKRYYDEIGTLNKKIAELEAQKAKAYNEGHKVGQKVAWDDINVKGMAREINELRETRDDLKAKLLEAENHRVEVEKIVEVAPEDYERLKKEQKELLDAATKAEERANEAEAELERLQTEGGPKQAEKSVGIVLGQAMNAFFSECEMMPYNPAELQRDSYAVKHCIGQIHEWCLRMEDALAVPVITEARVI